MTTTDPATVRPVVCLHAHAPEYRLPDERYDDVSENGYSGASTHR
jgi:hypothetical protein